MAELRLMNFIGAVRDSLRHDVRRPLQTDKDQGNDNKLANGRAHIGLS